MIFLAAGQAARATDGAADKFDRGAKSESRPLSARQRAVAEFDTDGDGKLSAAERRAARTALAQKKRALAAEEESSANGGPGSSSMAASGAGTNPTGMFPYGMGSYGGTNPYALTGSGGSYFYYGGGSFNQLTPGLTTTSGACMSMGSAGGGRR
jgi:hypothetical protein